MELRLKTLTKTDEGESKEGEDGEDEGGDDQKDEENPGLFLSGTLSWAPTCSPL